MTGPRRWASGVGGCALAIAGAAAGVGMAHAQPAPADPVVPQVPGVVTSIVTADGPLPVSPPPGAPTVPPIPADMRQQPGGVGSLDDVRANFSDPNSIVTNLFPDPAVPYTPVRQMPMGPPPPPDPAFAPPA